MSRKITAIAAILTSLLIPGVYGVDAVLKPSLVVDFEQPESRAAYSANGKLAATDGRVSSLVPGILDGHAYRQIKDAPAALKYDATGDARPDAGSAVIWFMAENYEPSKNGHDGWSINPISLFTLNFSHSSGEWSNMELVIYRGADAGGIRFEYNCSTPPQGFGAHPSIAAPLEDAHQGAWHCMVCTWTADAIAVYMDGRYHGSSLMQAGKAKMIRDFKPETATLYIRRDGKEQTFARGEITDVDDFSLYDHVLTKSEIKYIYEAGKGKAMTAPADLAHISCAGCFLDGKESVRAVADLTMLRRLCPGVAAPGSDARCKVSDEAGEVLYDKTLKLTSDDLATIMIQGLEKAGNYRLELAVRGGDGKEIVPLELRFSKPDTSWVACTTGTEDVTPAPWHNPVLGEDDSVSVWNRQYKFDGGAFPVSAKVASLEILSSPVRLVVDTAAGRQEPSWRVTERKAGNSFVEFKGLLAAPGVDAEYTTTVDFDGFVKAEVTFRKDCEAEAMSLGWQVSPQCLGTLMLPKPDKAEEAQRDFTYYDKANRAYILYLTSEKGGFCWMPSGDDNWNYRPGEKICHVNKKTGVCELSVITQPVKIPAGAKYTFCFTATPTRPQMPNSRAWRFMVGGDQYHPGDAIIRYGMFEKGGNLLLSKKVLENTKMKTRAIEAYASTDFLLSDVDVANWFFDEWLGFGYAYCMGTVMALPSCINSSKANYLVDNTTKSIKMPEFDHVEGYYLDCCGMGTCQNALHGCSRKDMLGRNVTVTTLLPLRDFIKRMTRVLHAEGRLLGAHGQYSFIPGVHGLCDYWLTGEELRMNVNADGVESYCDRKKITDEHLRENTNFRLLCNVTTVAILYGSADPLPAITRMMLEDIKFTGFLNEPGWNRADKVWKAFGKYKADQGIVHRHFEQDTIKSSSEDVLVTWYQCPDGKALLVACNLSGKDVTAELDISAFKNGDYAVFEEMSGSELQAKGGKVTVTVPARNFLMLGIR